MRPRGHLWRSFSPRLPVSVPLFIPKRPPTARGVVSDVTRPLDARHAGRESTWRPPGRDGSPVVNMSGDTSRIASSKLLPNKLTGTDAAALANLVASGHDGANQHERAARTRGRGSGTLKGGRGGGGGPDT